MMGELISLVFLKVRGVLIGIGGFSECKILFTMQK